ncbi:MAG: hypothetical protein WCS65_02100 [Verrucomicrobiae bacterium]
MNIGTTPNSTSSNSTVVSAINKWIASPPGVDRLAAFSALDPSPSSTPTGGNPWAKITDLKQISLIGGSDFKTAADIASEDLLHDLTTVSRGVLSDTQFGGLKKDLSLAFEMDRNDFNADPFFSGSSDSSSPNYSWQNSTGPTFTEPFYMNFLFKAERPAATPPVTGHGNYVLGPTWHRMRDFYSLYGNMTVSSSINATGVPVQEVPTDAARMTVSNEYSKQGGWEYNPAIVSSPNSLRYQDPRTDDPTIDSLARRLIPTKVLITPVLTQVAYLVSLTSSGPSGGPYQLGLMLDVFASIWNPYNVAMKCPQIRLSTRVPNIYITVTGGNVTHSVINASLTSNSTFGPQNLNALAFGDLTGTAPVLVPASVLSPGEVRVFCPPAASSGNLNITLNSSWAGGSASGMKISNWQETFSNGDGLGNRTTTNATVNWAGNGTTPLNVAFTIMDKNATPPSGLTPVNSNEGMKITCSYLTATVGNWVTFSQDNDFGFGLIANNAARMDEAGGLVTVGANATFSTGNLLPGNVGTKMPVALVRLYMTNERDAYLAPSFPARFLVDSSPRATLFSPYNGGNGTLYKFRPNYELKVGNAPVGTPGIAGLVGISGTGPLQGFWGGDIVDAASAARPGQSYVSLFEIPLRPLQSLGELQHFPINEWHNSPAYAIGNSFASPYVASNQAVAGSYNTNYQSSIGSPRTYVYQTQEDFSYLANCALFDSYFFSGIAPRADAGLADKYATIAVLTDSTNPLNQAGPLPDPRLRIQAFSGANSTVSDSYSAIRTALSANGTALPPDARDRPYSRSASYLMQDGAFNVNSTSLEAWKAFLKSVNSPRIPTLDPTTLTFTTPTSSGYPFPRTRPANGGAFTGSTSGGSSNRWNGYFKMDDAQVDALAARIVNEVKQRGPFLSLSDFINRRLTASNNAQSQRGALQAAIDASGCNNPVYANVSPTGYAHDSNAANTPASAAATGYLTQADILQAIGSHLTARGDTFLVRSYGDFVNKSSGKIEARALCEAVVQRFPDKVNPAEHVVDPPSGSSTDFGRRFRIVSFRWLGDDGN